MNKFIGMGRLTDDPKVSQTQGGKKIARATLAIDRLKEGTDFISLVAWEKRAEFMENYTHKGTKLLVEGRIQTGSYDKDGHKVYTTDVVIENVDFCEKKKVEPDGSEGQPKENPKDEWMNIPDGLDAEMPFK